MGMAADGWLAADVLVASDTEIMEDLMARDTEASTRVTVDHDTIREWVEERNGKPSHVKATAADDDPGVLRIDFPGYSGGEDLEAIPWEEWFEKFEESNLALIFRQEEESGEASNFNLKLLAS